MLVKCVYGWGVTLDKLNHAFTEAKIEELIDKHLLHPIDPEDPNTMYAVGIIYQTCGRGDTALANPYISEKRIGILRDLTPAFAYIPNKIIFLDPTDN